MEYDFSFINDKESTIINDTSNINTSRPNLKITTCCGNCRFFYKFTNSNKRGFCRLHYIRTKDKNNIKNDVINKCPKTYATLVCSAHKFNGIKRSIINIGNWVGIEFDTNGDPIE